MDSLDSNIWFGEDGLFHVDFGMCSHLTTELALKVMNESLNLVKTISVENGGLQQKYEVLVHAQKIMEVDSNARSILLGSELGAVTNACAIVLHKSSLNWLVGEIFLFFDHPSYPCKLFTSETKAIYWLRAYRARLNKR